jgi:putative transposase
MARPLRIAYDNAAYHVMARGNRRETIFFEDADRRRFLAKLDEALNKHKAELFAYCLMPNHYHFFLRTRRPNLSSLIHDLNSSYANWLKAKYGLVGVVFQGRFKSIVVDTDAYAAVLSAYIHLNPRRRKIVEKPEDYLWSSYRDYLGLRRKGLERLRPEFILAEFNRAKKAACSLYHAFIEERLEMKDPLAEFRGFPAAGSDSFRKSVKSKIRPANYREIGIDSRPDKVEISPDDFSRAMAETLGIPTEQLCLAKQRNHIRPMGIYLMKKHCPIDLKSIGDYWNMDYVAVSMAAKRFKSKISADPEIASTLNRIESLLNIG